MSCETQPQNNNMKQTPQIQRTAGGDLMIYIHPKLKKRIAEKFNVSHTTVRAALMRFNNSETAEQIRRYALELMKAELKKLEKTL